MEIWDKEKRVDSSHEEEEKRSKKQPHSIAWWDATSTNGSLRVVLKCAGIYEEV
jgi:hypothetical protein